MVGMRPIGIGMVGAGAVARAVHAPGFRQAPGAALVGVYDADRGAAEAVGSARVHPTLDALLADPAVDAVVVATPNAHHHDAVLAALAAGKHVLCEKPMALDLGQARAMLAAAEAARRVHMIAYTYQFAPGMRYLHDLVASGALGEVRTVRGAFQMAPAPHTLGWRSSRALAGSGALADIGSHLIQLARLCAGEPLRVIALERRFGPAGAAEVDDWVGFLAEFADGATGTFEVSRACPGLGSGIDHPMTLEVYGTAGSAVFRLQDPWALQLALGHSARDPAGPLARQEVPPAFLALPGTGRDVHADDPRWGYRFDQALRFVTSIRQGVSPSPSFVDGMRGQAVLDAVLAAARSGAWTRVAA
jgi:predicted dehydrogenase